MGIKEKGGALGLALGLALAEGAHGYQHEGKAN